MYKRWGVVEKIQTMIVSPNVERERWATRKTRRRGGGGGGGEGERERGREKGGGKILC
jgi:hypothetical protein